MTKTHVQSPRVLVIDSGVGGLSICAALVERVPDCEILFVADNGFFPYGEKDPADLRDQIIALYRSHAHDFDPHLVVVACNTATLCAIEALRREKTNESLLGFIGTEPAIRPAIRRTYSNVVGLLATHVTVSAASIQEKIEEISAQVNVVAAASHLFVDLAEAKMRGQKVELERLRDELLRCFPEPILQEMDTCILGCTHFPLLKDEFKRLAPSLNWIDTGEDVSRRACVLLNRTGLYTPSVQTGYGQSKAHRMTFTDPTSAAPVSRQSLQKLGLESLAESV